MATTALLGTSGLRVVHGVQASIAPNVQHPGWRLEFPSR